MVAMRGWTRAAVAVIATACGPRVRELQVQLRTCGRDGPAPLLELDSAVPGYVQRFGDELLVSATDEDWEDRLVPGEQTDTWLVGELRLSDGPEDSILLDRDARLLPWPDLALGDDDVLYTTHEDTYTLRRTATR